MRLAHHAYTHRSLGFRRRVPLSFEYAEQAQVDVKRVISEAIEQMFAVGFNAGASSSIKFARTFQKAPLRRGHIKAVSNQHRPLINRGAM
jgi:hypothetical protein